jgi:hypothetical protein
VSVRYDVRRAGSRGENCYAVMRGDDVIVLAGETGGKEARP